MHLHRFATIDASAPSTGSTRIVSVDLLRGLVMMLMALDHTRDYFSGCRLQLNRRRCRRFDTVFGRLAVRAPRFDGCRHCVERLIASPVSELLPERVSPELRHLQAELAAQLPYRQAAALLEELLPGNRQSKLCHNTQPNARCRQTH
jgi:hypothetical protein